MKILKANKNLNGAGGSIFSFKMDKNKYNVQFINSVSPLYPSGPTVVEYTEVYCGAVSLGLKKGLVTRLSPRLRRMAMYLVTPMT